MLRKHAAGITLNLLGGKDIYSYPPPPPPLVTPLCPCRLPLIHRLRLTSAEPQSLLIFQFERDISQKYFWDSISHRISSYRSTENLILDLKRLSDYSYLDCFLMHQTPAKKSPSFWPFLYRKSPDCCASSASGF